MFTFIHSTFIKCSFGKRSVHKVSVGSMSHVLRRCQQISNDLDAAFCLAKVDQENKRKRHFRSMIYD